MTNSCPCWLPRMSPRDSPTKTQFPDIPQTPISVAGDLWLIGDHKLLVGDATSREAISTLMAHAAADLVFTDLPYSIDYEGYTEERLKIKSDRMSTAEFKHFLESAFRSYRPLMKPGASLYVCHSFQDAMEPVEATRYYAEGHAESMILGRNPATASLRSGRHVVCGTLGAWHGAKTESIPPRGATAGDLWRARRLSQRIASAHLKSKLPVLTRIPYSLEFRGTRSFPQCFHDWEQADVSRAWGRTPKPPRACTRISQAQGGKL